MDYTLIRSNRKTATLTVTEDAAVVVRAPRRMPQAMIDRFVEEHAAWIEACIEKRRAYALAHPPLTEYEEQKLRRAATEFLPQRVAYWADIMGVTPTGVRITGAKKRFGSCSGRNAISFSWRLMQYPPEAIDYVVVHELAHLRYMNHGAEFYALIARYLPDWKTRRALLRA